MAKGDRRRVLLTDLNPTLVEAANMNKRLHPMARARITRYWRQLACAAVPRELRGRQLQRAEVLVTVRWPDRRVRDPGNWMPLAKACIDGLTDAGVWPDDNRRHVIGPDIRADEDLGPHQVRIDIQELP